jgi:hypothetical protein
MVRRVRDNGYELCFYVHSTDRFWPIAAGRDRLLRTHAV